MHSHHPFLLGDAALRAAWTRRLPLVFTHHTLYEQYTHYVPLDSEAMQRVAIQMATEYCNLCTHVIAPSESIAELLAQRCVTTPITAIPTGIDLDAFGSGDGAAFRRRFEHSPPTRWSSATSAGWRREESRLSGAGGRRSFWLSAPTRCSWSSAPATSKTTSARSSAKLAGAEQLVMAGSQTGQDLVDAYAAMDVFAFSSQSETQGMVLAEAMAARTPVVALDGPGVRDVVNDVQRPAAAGRRADRGRSSPRWMRSRAIAMRCDRLGESARQSVREFGLDVCADRILDLYEQLIEEQRIATTPTTARGTACSAGWRSSGTCSSKKPPRSPRRWSKPKPRGANLISRLVRSSGVCGGKFSRTRLGRALAEPRRLAAATATSRG